MFSTSTTSETSPDYVHVMDLERGGMGAVELVLRDRGGFHRLYARKRIHAELREDDSFRRMFLEEARIAGLLRHTNVVSVLDYGEDADGPFLIMDYVDGLSCADIIRGVRRLDALVPLSVCLRLGRDVATGLHAAHELRSEVSGEHLELVHRDVSPQNVLVGFDGIARVTDFGIARASTRPGDGTTKGVLKGKLGYISPEQLRFDEPDRRSDLFSLGVTLYELLTANRLYRRETEREVAKAILTEPPPDLGWERDDMPPQLVSLVMRLLAKAPEDRPQTAAEVANELREIERELIADPQFLEPAPYLLETFGDAHAARKAKVQHALGLVRASLEESNRAHRTRRKTTKRWRHIAAAVVAVALVGSVAALAIDGEETDAAHPLSVEAGSAPTPQGVVVTPRAPSEPAADFREEETQVLAEPVVAEPVAEPVVVEPVVMEPIAEPSPPRRARGTRRRHPIETMTEDRTTMPTMEEADFWPIE